MPYSLADLRTRTRDLLNEDTAAFFTDAQLDRFLADAALDISGVVRCVEDSTLIELALNDIDYALPTDCIEVVHVQDAATGRGLPKITATMGGHSSSDTEGDTALRYFVWERTLFVEPSPNAAAVGKTLRVFYFRETTDVTLLPQYAQHLAVSYACTLAKLQDKLPGEAAVFWSMYTNGVAFRRTDTYEHTPHALDELMMAEEAVSG